MGYSKPRRRARTKPRKESKSERLIRMLMTGGGKASSVLELYYWSREPGMIEIMRGIVAMPEETRGALEAFLALSRDPKTIRANISQAGVLMLAAPEAAQAVALATYIAENEGDDATVMLN